jgi:hypothetical protein
MHSTGKPIWPDSSMCKHVMSLPEDVKESGLWVPSGDSMTIAHSELPRFRVALHFVDYIADGLRDCFRLLLLHEVT